MAGWRTWTVDKFRRHPFIAWPTLVGSVLIALGAVLTALGVIGDWGKWAVGMQAPQIVEFQQSDRWDDPSYYVVIQNHSHSQVRLFAVEYNASPVRPPGRGSAEPTAALMAEHEYRVPLLCGASRKIELNPNFVVEADKSEGFRLTLIAPGVQRGRECEIKLRFDSSAGSTEWRQFKTYFQHVHKPCKIIHAPTGRVPFSELQGADCFEIRP